GNAKLGGNGSVSRQAVRVDGLETDLRELTGSIEQVARKVFLISERFDKLVSDIDFRLSALEKVASNLTQNINEVDRLKVAVNQILSSSKAKLNGNSESMQDTENSYDPGPETGELGQKTLGKLSQTELAAYSGASNTIVKDSRQQSILPNASAAKLTSEAEGQLAGLASSGVSSPEPLASSVSRESKILPSGSPRERYMFAFSLLRQAKYESAELALKEFLDSHSGEKLAGNARYWLGETYYVRRAYVFAAETFLEAFEFDREGVKAPDSLLKLGMSLAALGKGKEACAAFGKLEQEYPEATDEIKRSLERQFAKSSCR
ncbi:MAG: hypothetical protein CFH06_01159, partial [Alphaproteobacteria bacterium MarineAlpha3_Bin5]